jgi:rhodanese-related sulfurtransferase
MKLLIASLLPLAHGVVTELSTQQLFEGIQENKFQVIVDVRSQAEFDAGHIEGATLLENLFYFGMGSLESASPADLEGCELCHIAVYDRSGGRTINAIEILEEAGFMNLYNGQGTSQWTSAGYSLVTDVSVVPPCTTDPAAQEQCSALEEAPTTSPTVNDPTAIRSLDAAQFVQLRNQGMFDVILDVREGRLIF